STASNAALLIVVEPLVMTLASPIYLGERLSRREAAGAGLAVVGTVLVVVNGIPGMTQNLVPHWQGDLLLVLAGVAYASYSLLGRRVLHRHAPLGVTTRSLGWGAVGILPIVAAEWASGARPVWTAPAVAGSLYLAVVISALGYVAWNWALARIGPPGRPLPQRPANCRGASGRAPPRRAPDRLHACRRHGNCCGPRRCLWSRAQLTVYSKTWPSHAATSFRTSAQTV